MLKLEIPLQESFDERTNEFIVSAATVVELEHSLASMSKWEAFFEKPFLATKDKTSEEVLWYVEAMIVTADIPTQDLLLHFQQSHYTQINDYINAKHTATWFPKTNDTPSKEVITAELIYYWMISLNIPLECEHWHLNRLFTLIRVFNAKNAPEKKMSRADMVRERQRINEQRRAQYGTRG